MRFKVANYSRLEIRLDTLHIYTDKQTNKQTASYVLPTPTDIVGVGNKVVKIGIKHAFYTLISLGLH